MSDCVIAAKRVRLLNIVRRVLAVILPLTFWFPLTGNGESLGVPFWIVYLLGCCSIVAGDILARKWNLWDELTIKRNNISNWMFAVGVFIFVILGLIFENKLVLLLFIGMVYFGVYSLGVLFVRYITCTICEIRWGKFSGIHTIANKIAGYALMLFIPIVAIMERLPKQIFFNKDLSHTEIEIYVAWALIALYVVATIEELILAATMKQFDPFRKSIFCKNQGRRSAEMDM